MVDQIQLEDLRRAVEGHARRESATGAVRPSRALRRDETPQDLPGALVFLASAESDFVTGQTIAVDGGNVSPDVGCYAARNSGPFRAG